MRARKCTGVSTRCVAPLRRGFAQAVRDAAVGQERHALQTERRTRAVAAQPLESFAIAFADRDTRVDVEPPRLGGPWALAPGAQALVVVGLRHGHAVLVEAEEG